MTFNEFVLEEVPNSNRLDISGMMDRRDHIRIKNNLAILKLLNTYYNCLHSLTLSNNNI